MFISAVNYRKTWPPPPGPGRRRRGGNESSCKVNVRQGYSPNILSTTAQERRELCTSRPVKVNGRGRRMFSDLPARLRASNCDKEQASGCPPLTQAQNEAIIKAFMAHRHSGAPVWKYSQPLGCCYYSDCWVPV